MLATGRLVLGADNGLASNAVLNLAASAAGVFDLSGHDQTLAGLSRTTANSATVTNSGTSLRTLTLNVGGAESYIYGGTISGLVALVKGGTGTQALSGTKPSGTRMRRRSRLQRRMLARW